MNFYATRSSNALTNSSSNQPIMEDYCTVHDSIVQSVTFKSDHIIHPILSQALSTHVKFCVNQILFTIWSISLYFMYNFKLQKLVI